MDNFGYWIFLLILYLLSAIMKKKKQKAAYRKMEEVEEKNDWKAPDFIKELFSDFDDSEDVKEEGHPSLVGEDETDDHALEQSLQYESETPSGPTQVTPENLSSLNNDKQIGRIKHKSLKKVVLKTSFFKKQDDVKMAIIYKEILDKPRALRKQFR